MAVKMEPFRYVLSRFPKNICFGFAYGSGVKKQANYDDRKSKMIDMIYCVENSEEWHKENILKNPQDYSMCKILGEKFIGKFQDNFAARCYFNTMVPITFNNGRNYCMIKYGIISRNNLIDDLLNWKYLYVAGRLQKPVEILIHPNRYNYDDDKELKQALQKNLESAIHTSLLLLPQNFNAFDLFYTVSNLSYSGDFRMIFGENKHKVHNIVSAQIEGFYKLYLPILQDMSTFCLSSTCSNKFNFEQDKSTSVTEIHIAKLPKELLSRIFKSTNVKPDEINSMAKSRNYKNLITDAVSDIVKRSSILQSIKNIPTAGFRKSISYSWEKSLKTFS